MANNYKLKSCNYIKIDKTDEGYEYSLYDDEKRLIDGGILENYELSENEAFKEVLKMYNIPSNIGYKELDFEIEENLEEERNKDMNKYETIIILKDKLSEEERLNVLERVKKFIEENGKIDNIQDKGERKLAYEVRKNNRGYFYQIDCFLKPEDVNELERIYRITDEILKFITIKA